MDTDNVSDTGDSDTDSDTGETGDSDTDSGKIEVRDERRPSGSDTPESPSGAPPDLASRQKRAALIAVAVVLVAMGTGLWVAIANPPSTSRASSTDNTSSAAAPDLSEEFCVAAQDFVNAPYESAAESGGEPDVGAAMQLMRDRADAVVENAPPELVGDAEAMVEGLDRLMAALEKVGYDPEKLGPEEQQALSDAEFEAASERVMNAIQEGCALEDPTGGLGDAPPAPTEGAPGVSPPE